MNDFAELGVVQAGRGAAYGYGEFYFGVAETLQQNALTDHSRGAEHQNLHCLSAPSLPVPDASISPAA